MEIIVNEINSDNIDNLIKESINEMKWKLIDTESSTFFEIKDIDKNILGFAKIGIILVNFNKIYSLTHLWIIPEKRGGNIGTKVIEHFIEKYTFPNSTRFCINDPNPELINILLNLGEAQKITENVIGSKISLQTYPGNQVGIEKDTPIFSQFYFNKFGGYLILNIGEILIPYPSNMYSFLSKSPTKDEIDDFQSFNVKNMQKCVKEIENSEKLQYLLKNMAHGMKNSWLE